MRFTHAFHITARVQRLARRLPLVLAAALVAAAVAQAAGGATTAGPTFSNTAAIGIPDCCVAQTATPYPLTIDGSALSGNVTGVTVTLLGLNHSAAGDLDILLAAPGGQAVMLMSDSGVSVNGDITFSDGGAAFPVAGAVGTGSYKPSNPVNEDCTNGSGDTFPSPPAGPIGSTMASLNGVPATGTWSLYVIDDCEVDSGTLAGVQLNVTTTGTGGSPTAGAAAIADCCPSTAATLSPSTITVQGLAGSITGVMVTLKNLSHQDAADLDIVLVGPAPDNKKVLLLSDAGASESGSNVVISNAASGTAPPGPLGSNTYKPTNNNEDCATGATGERISAPAPPYGDSLADAFDGTSANGVWSLYVVDDCGGDTGQIAGGWSLEFAGPTSVTVATFAAKRVARGVTLRWRTAHESSLLGFNVFRATGKRFVRLNKVMVSAKRRAQGASYSFVDRTARKGRAYTYKLQIVGLDGTKAFRGTVKVKAK